MLSYPDIIIANKNPTFVAFWFSWFFVRVIHDRIAVLAVVLIYCPTLNHKNVNDISNPYL